CVDASGDLEADLAEIFDVVDVLEAIADFERHWNGARVGQGAVVEAGTADRIRDGIDVGPREVPSFELGIELGKVLLTDMGRAEVLRVCDDDLTEAVGIREIGERIHLGVAGIPGGDSGDLERDHDRTVTGLTVGLDVVTDELTV